MGSRELQTIQKRNKLNSVYRIGERGPGSAYHAYDIHRYGADPNTFDGYLLGINFQSGPREDPMSQTGVLDVDLLEIVRDRLKHFQSGEYTCRENACALAHLEEALMWLNKRVEDRAARGVLGTSKK